jgi:hypothetical protein
MTRPTLKRCPNQRSMTAADLTRSFMSRSERGSMHHVLAEADQSGYRLNA